MYVHLLYMYKYGLYLEQCMLSKCFTALLWIREVLFSLAGVDKLLAQKQQITQLSEME